MKFNFGKQNNTKAAYACIVVALAVVFAFLLFNFSYVKGFFATLFRFTRPLIVAFVLAYLLNPLFTFFEKKVFRFLEKKKPHPKAKRFLSLTLTYLVVLAFLSLLLVLFVPQILESSNELVGKMQYYLESAEDWAKGRILSVVGEEQAANSVADALIGSVNSLLSSFSDLMIRFLPGAMTYFTGLMSGIFDVLIAILLSVYFLYYKERYAARGRKLCASLLSEQNYGRLMTFLGNTDKTFGGFVRGKIIDSLIIALLTFVVLLIFRMPYYQLVTLIIGVTNVVPYFGPIIGAIPSAFIIFIADPVKALWFIVIIFIIQQLDGNVIGPRILGDSIGLSSLGVITGVLLMGALFGVVGFFIGVPLYAILRMLLLKGVDLIRRRREEKAKEKEEGEN